MTDREWRDYVASLTPETFDPQLFAKNLMLRLQMILLAMAKSNEDTTYRVQSRLDAQGGKLTVLQLDADRWGGHTEQLEQRLSHLEDAVTALALAFDQYKARKERSCGE